VTGEVKSADPAADEKKDADKKDADKKDTDKKADAEKKKDDTAAAKLATRKTRNINVVLVADVDLLDASVFGLRSQAEAEELGVRFDNIVFVLNALDSLAGDDRFVEIRKRRPAHRTLAVIEKKVAESRIETNEKRKEFEERFANQKKAKQAAGEKANQNSVSCRPKLKATSKREKRFQPSCGNE